MKKNEPGKEGPQIDIDEAYNNEPFMRYLVGSGVDEEKISQDPKIVEQKYELYQTREKYKINITELYKDRISADLGVTLGPDDEKYIATEIDRIAEADPDRLKELQAQIEELAENKRKIDEAWRELEKLGINKDDINKRGELTDILADLNKARKFFGRFGKWMERFSHFDKFFGSEGAGKELDALEQVREKLPPLESLGDVDRFRAEIKRKLSAVKGVAEEMNIFDGIEGELMDSLAGIEILRTSIQEKVIKRLKDMISGNSLTFDTLLERGHEYMKLVEKMSDGDNGMNKLTPEQRNELIKNLDGALDRLAQGAIDGIIISGDLGSVPLKDMEGKLGKFLRLKSLGGRKEYTDIANALAEYLNKSAGGLDDSEDSRMKRIVIARIIAKIKLNQYATK